mgnify:CR=1 FL=1
MARLIASVVFRLWVTHPELANKIIDNIIIDNQAWLRQSGLVAERVVAQREWTSADGKFKLVASFVKCEKGYVTLKRDDVYQNRKKTKTIEVLATRLGKADQTWITAELKRAADAKRRASVAGKRR